MNNKLLPALAIAAAAVPAAASAEVTGNIGWVSEYLYRGIFQEDSSASAGIDYASDGGFYIGSWLADVGQGLEQDVYFGYSGGEDLTYKIGFTGYYYTDDFDDTYEEVNLGIGYKIFALDVAVGEYDGFGTPADYTFTSLTISPEMGPYYKFGSFGDDFDGDYIELGYGFDFMGVDLSVALTYSDDLPVSDPDDGDDGDYQLTFGIKETFGFGAE
ncbi:MAG TPA: TorF family putative porin [Gammaproteobacteria bacterium]